MCLLIVDRRFQILRKIKLSDNNYEDIARALVKWVLTGSLIGVILDNIILFFAIGGIIGILSSIVTLYSKSEKVQE